MKTLALVVLVGLFGACRPEKKKEWQNLYAGVDSIRIIGSWVDSSGTMQYDSSYHKIYKQYIGYYDSSGNEIDSFVPVIGKDKYEPDSTGRDVLILGGGYIGGDYFERAIDSLNNGKSYQLAKPSDSLRKWSKGMKWSGTQAKSITRAYKK